MESLFDGANINHDIKYDVKCDKEYSTDYEIDLDRLKKSYINGTKIWKPQYKLSRASIIQIILTFLNIRNRPKINDKINVYQTNLDEQLVPLIDELLDCFKKCLVWNDYIGEQVIIYNLLSFLPKNVFIIIEGYDEKLKYANIGNLIKALKQRIKFIIDRPMPKIYIDSNDDKYRESFLHLQKMIKSFLEDVEYFEESFIKANDKSHKVQQTFYKKRNLPIR